MEKEDRMGSMMEARACLTSFWRSERVGVDVDVGANAGPKGVHWATIAGCSNLTLALGFGFGLSFGSSIVFA